MNITGLASIMRFCVALLKLPVLLQAHVFLSARTAMGCAVSPQS